MSFETSPCNQRTPNISESFAPIEHNISIFDTPQPPQSLTNIVSPQLEYMSCYTSYSKSLHNSAQPGARGKHFSGTFCLPRSLLMISSVLQEHFPLLGHSAQSLTNETCPRPIQEQGGSLSIPSKRPYPGAPTRSSYIMNNSATPAGSGPPRGSAQDVPANRTLAAVTGRRSSGLRPGRADQNGPGVGGCDSGAQLS